MIQELEWWQSELQQWNGKSVIPQKHQHILTTDASGLGWGWWWHKLGSRHRKEDEARGFFSRRESNNSSNWSNSFEHKKMGRLSKISIL